MARVDPTTAATKWATRLSASTNDIKAGVERVTVAPGQAAARQADVWLLRVQAAKDKWKRNVAAVSLADWQNKMITVGIGRIGSGASANQGKVQSFMTSFLPHVDAGVAKVKAMPNATLDDRINRAVAMIRHNATYTKPASSGGG